MEIVMEKNPHIRTDTSPEREKHLRVLAGSDNTLWDAMAMLDEARKAHANAEKRIALLEAQIGSEEE